MVNDLLLAVFLALTAIGLSLLLWPALVWVSLRCRALYTERARDVLRRRYVAGEIDCGEFWRLMSQFPQD